MRQPYTRDTPADRLGFTTPRTIGQLEAFWTAMLPSMVRNVLADGGVPAAERDRIVASCGPIRLI